MPPAFSFLRCCPRTLQGLLPHEAVLTPALQKVEGGTWYTAFHPHNAGNSMSLLCPGNILAVGSMMLLAWLTAVQTSPTPVAMSFSLPACVHTSPAA